jgi:hypothetical protein
VIRTFPLDPVLDALPFFSEGFEIQSIEFWMEVSDFEITLDTNNELYGLFLSRVPADIRSSLTGIRGPTCEVRWICRQRASAIAVQTVLAISATDGDISSSACDLLENLFSCSPCEVMDVVADVFRDFLSGAQDCGRGFSLCLAVVCSVRRQCPVIEEFLDYAHPHLLQLASGSVDPLQALAALEKAIEIHGFSLAPETFLQCFSFLSQLFSKSPDKRISVLSCVHAVLKRRLWAFPEFPIQIIIQWLSEFHTCVHSDLGDPSVISSWYTALELFLCFLPAPDPDVIGPFMASPVTLLAEDPVGDDSPQAVCQKAALALIGKLFAVYKVDLTDKALELFPCFLRILTRPSTPTSEVFEAILKAVEIIEEQVEPFLGLLLDLLGTHIKSRDPIILRYSLSLLICFLHYFCPFEAPLVIDIIDLCLNHCDFQLISDPTLIISFGSLLLSLPEDLACQQFEAYKRICQAACHNLLEAHGLADIQDLDFAYDGVFDGFAVVMSICENKSQFWEENSDELVAIVNHFRDTERFPVAAHTLLSYFRFVSAADRAFSENLSALVLIDLLILAWGITSDEESVQDEAVRLWDHWLDASARLAQLSKPALDGV